MTKQQELIANHKFSFKLDTKYDIPPIPQEDIKSVGDAVGCGDAIACTHNNADAGSYLKVAGRREGSFHVAVRYYKKDHKDYYQYWDIPKWVFRSLSESGINYKTGDRGQERLTYGKPDEA